MISKNEVLDYVMNTPGNTNRAVLSSLLDNFEKDTPAGNIVNITNNSSGNPKISGSGLISSDGIETDSNFPFNIPLDNSKLFIYCRKLDNDGNEKFFISFFIQAITDIYTITVNSGKPLIHERLLDGSGYTFESEWSDTPITGQTYNVVITDKV